MSVKDWSPSGKSDPMTKRERIFIELNDLFEEREWTTDDIINALMGELTTKQIEKLLRELQAQEG